MYDQSESSFSAQITREFFRSVYSYMFVALGISGIVAYTIGTDEQLFVDWFVTPTGMSPYFGWLCFLISFKFCNTMGIQPFVNLFIIGSFCFIFSVNGFIVSQYISGLRHDLNCHNVFRCRWSFCRNGYFGLYHKNRPVQIWKPSIHGIHRNVHCWNSEYIHRKCFF